MRAVSHETAKGFRPARVRSSTPGRDTVHLLARQKGSEHLYLALSVASNNARPDVKVWSPNGIDVYCDVTKNGLVNLTELLRGEINRLDGEVIEKFFEIPIQKFLETQLLNN